MSDKLDCPNGGECQPCERCWAIKWTCNECGDDIFNWQNDEETPGYHNECKDKADKDYADTLEQCWQDRFKR